MIELENAKTRIFCPCPSIRDWYWPCSQSCFIIIYNILSIQFQELPTSHSLSIFLVLIAYILVHWRCLSREILQQIRKHLQRHSLSFAAWKRRKITFFIAITSACTKRNKFDFLDAPGHLFLAIFMWSCHTFAMGDQMAVKTCFPSEICYFFSPIFLPLKKICIEFLSRILWNYQ